LKFSHVAEVPLSLERLLLSTGSMLHQGLSAKAVDAKMNHSTRHGIKEVPWHEVLAMLSRS